MDDHEKHMQDAEIIHRVLPPQLAIEMMRSGSCALVSDAMREFTEAYSDGKLSEKTYLSMISMLADLLSQGRLS